LRIRALLQWAGLAILLCIGLAGAKRLVDFARLSALDETCCFSGYFTAARIALTRTATGNLQDLSWFREQTIRNGFPTGDIFFGNPPSAALMLAPIALEPPRQARIIWTWLSLSFWAAGVALIGFFIVRSSQGSLLAAAPALLSLATLFEPLRSNLERAHVYIFIFLLQSICCWLWLKNRPGPAGAVGGAVLALKGYGLPLIALAVLRRDWKFVAGAGASLTILGLVSGVLLGFKQWVYFFGAYSGNGAGASFFDIATPALQTFRSFLMTALHRPPGRVVFLLQTAIVVAYVLWLSEFRIKRKARGASPSPASMSACILLNLVFSPYAEDNGYALAMTALLLMIPELRRLSLASILTVSGGILLSWPFHLRDREVMTSWQLVTDYARLWGAVVLLVAASIAEHSRRRVVVVEAGKSWAGVWVAAAVGIGLVMWYVKPFRDPVNGPLLAVGANDGRIALVRLDIEERPFAVIPASCEKLSSLGFAGDRAGLYAGCAEPLKTAVIDLRQRRESAGLASPRPLKVRSRPRHDEVWVLSEGSPGIRIFRGGTAELLGEISLAPQLSDIVFSGDGARAWVSDSGSNAVYVLDAAHRRQIGQLRAGDGPVGLALTTDGGKLLVANSRSNTISVIDAASSQVLSQIGGCAGPNGVVTTRIGSQSVAYVICTDDSSVGVIDTQRFQVIQRIRVGGRPIGIAMHPNGMRVYVAIDGADRIVVLETGPPSRIVWRVPVRMNTSQLAVAP